jgi:hypothetical protein
MHNIVCMCDNFDEIREQGKYFTEVMKKKTYLILIDKIC